jgi:BON domain
MEYLEDSDRPNDSPSEFIDLGDLIDAETTGAEVPASSEIARSDLNALPNGGVPRRFLITMISAMIIAPISFLIIAYCARVHAPSLTSNLGRRPSQSRSDFSIETGSPTRTIASPPAPSRPSAGSSFVTGADAQPVTRRVVDRLNMKPTLARSPIVLESHGKSVTLSGQVPSCYEAMLAHRAVQQTPGVEEVIDRLKFQLPDESHANPLVGAHQLDDLEPYLTYHIRRHVGALAHIDRVLVNANTVQICGTLLDANDNNRVEAIIRSVPILRDFSLRPMFIPLLGQPPSEKPERVDRDAEPDSRLADLGSAPFKETEIINGTSINVGNPQFTLTWDTDADLDLYVIEPGGKQICREEPRGKQGGVMDVDNTRGFGPENICWFVGPSKAGSSRTTRVAPSGVYHWFVAYRGGNGSEPKATHWTVRIKHDDKVTVVQGRLWAFDQRSMVHGTKMD